MNRLSTLAATLIATSLVDAAVVSRSGNRVGKLKRLGNIVFDYYRSGDRMGKLKRIGNVVFDYYYTGRRTGKFRRIGNVAFEYYGSGDRMGKLRRIGSITFDYDRDNRMATIGTLSSVRIVILA
ncbi:MAG: hypothetical protein F6K19_46695 [Cyanothece sp. SIO1E1]|nr:hypothetical protein [Cyanothece sp. SIO1E1]